MTKFQYNIRRNSALRTSVTNSEKWVLDFLNDLGQNGELVVSITEMTEPSTFAAADGTNIPNYVVLVLTATPIDDKLPDVKIEAVAA